MSTTRLRVQNVLGVVAADLPIGPGILLVGGTNGAGKSSLLHAAAAVATADPYLRGASLKKDLQRLVHRGAEGGAATFDWGEGQRRITWPDGKLQTVGEPRDFGSPLALGIVRFMDLDQKKRLGELAARLDLAPTREDLVKGMPEGTSAEILDALWSRIEVSGWDPVHRESADHSKRLQGRWEEVTREKWGPQKSADWCPASLLRGEPYTEAAADEEVAAAEAVLDKLRIAEAVGTDEIRRAEEGAAPLAALRAEADELQAEADTTEKALRRLMAQRAKLKPPPEVQAARGQPCPHCGGLLEVTAEGGKAVLAALDAPKPPSEEEQEAVEASRRAWAEVEGAIAQAQEELAETQRQQKAVLTKLAAAEEAAKRLARLQALPRSDEEALAAARLALSKAQAKRDAIRALLRAQAIRAEWEINEPIVAALAPGGVRARVMAERIGAFNAELAALCATAGFPVVEVTAEADLAIGGTPYPLASESERWRADLLLTLAFAQREGARLVLVDRLDVLAPNLRPGVLMLLKAIGIPALVAVTVKDPGTLPTAAMASAGLGRTAWVQGGRVELLGQ